MRLKILAIGVAVHVPRIRPKESVARQRGGVGVQVSFGDDVRIARNIAGLPLHVQRKINGVRVSRLGELYRPAYFVGGYAIHGSPSVPNFPASHGRAARSRPSSGALTRSPSPVTRGYRRKRRTVRLVSGRYKPATDLAAERSAATGDCFHMGCTRRGDQFSSSTVIHLITPPTRTCRSPS